MRKKSDIKTNNDALLKSEDVGGILRSLEDAEQRQADVRANAAVDKSCKTGTLPPKTTMLDDERTENRKRWSERE